MRGLRLLYVYVSYRECASVLRSCTLWFPVSCMQIFLKTPESLRLERLSLRVGVVFSQTRLFGVAYVAVILFWPGNQVH